MALSYERLKELHQGLFEALVDEGATEAICLEHMRKFASIDIEQIQNADTMLQLIANYPERFADDCELKKWMDWKQHHVNDLQAVNEMIFTIKHTLIKL